MFILQISMKTKALLMTIAMMSAALAGCTGSDGVAEIDDETLQQLFEDNIQDFMNNTTVTVNQEIHHHNNTTVNNYETTHEYNNTTNVDGGEVINHNTDNSVNNYNGSNIGSTMQMFTVSWSIEEILGYDPADVIVTSGSQNNQNTSNGSTSGQSTLLYVAFYNNQLVEFRDLSCEEWMNYGYYDNDDWENFLMNNYGNDWENRDSVAYALEDHFSDNRDHYGYDAYDQCGISGNNYLGESLADSRVVLYEVELGIGQAMSYLAYNSGVTVDVNCDDGYGTGMGNGTSLNYIGGQANCTVTGSAVPTWTLNFGGYQYDDNGDVLSPDGRALRYAETIYDDGPERNFAVYFTIHDVVVYDIDDE